MNETNLVEFLSKQCKNKVHIECCGLWEGLGFEVLCECMCHTNNSVIVYHKADARKQPTEVIRQTNQLEIS